MSQSIRVRKSITYRVGDQISLNISFSDVFIDIYKYLQIYPKIVEEQISDLHSTLIFFFLSQSDLTGVKQTSISYSRLLFLI